MIDPPRLLNDARASRAAVELLRALAPPRPAPPDVRLALSHQLARLVAHGGAKAALGIGWLKAAALVCAGGASAGALAWSLSSPETQAPLGRAKAPMLAGSQHVALPRAATGQRPEPLPDIAPQVPERHDVRDGGVRKAEPPDRLAEEELLVEQARSVLQENPTRALGLLRQHQARFGPGGQLAAERMYLRIDCLRRLGQREQAEREARALIVAYPTSPYARRVPQLLATPLR